jgi:hypothetical protein
MNGFHVRVMMLIISLSVVVTAGSDAVAAETGAAADTVEPVLVPGASCEVLPALDKMVVRASGGKTSHPSVVEPVEVFDADRVLSTAGAAEDIGRYITSLPQAVAGLGEDFDNALYVRGGRPSEVVFIVDGIEFENINHFSKANGSGGPIGFINSEFVKKVEFYAGNAPAAFPSRLSSVVAVDMKAGAFDRAAHSIGVKLTGGTFSSEGPIAGGGGSYAVAGRYIDFSTLRSLIHGRGIPRLGDVFFKGTLFGNEFAELSLTGLGSYNRYKFSYPVVEADDITGVQHRNTVDERQRILQGGCGLTGRLHRGVVAHRADVSFSFREGRDDDSLRNYSDAFFAGRYTDNPLREDHDRRMRATVATVTDWAADSVLSATFGGRISYQQYRFFTGDYHRYSGRYTFCSENGPLEIIHTEEPRTRSLQLDAMETGGHAEITVQRGPVAASVGMRADYYRLLGKTAFSPGCAIRVKGRDPGTIKLSGGVQHQFPTDMPTLFFYYFSYNAALSDAAAATVTRGFLRQLDPLRCYQTAIELERQMTPRLHLQMNAYYKWYDREYHYRSPEMQEVFTLDKSGEPVLSRQDGRRRSCGFEGLLAGPLTDRFTCSLGGSVFDVKNRYRDGIWYDDWTNVGYTVTVSAGVRLFAGHHISLTAQGNGGRPYCPEIIVADCIGRKSTVYEPGGHYYSRRFDRLFSTHFRYGIEHRFSRCSGEWFIEIINLFNSRPVLEYRFNGEFFREIKPFGILPIAGGKISW